MRLSYLFQCLTAIVFYGIPLAGANAQLSSLAGSKEFAKPTTVVVTGASGHVGLSLIEKLHRDKNVHIRALYLNDPQRLAKLIRRLEAYETFAPERFSMHMVDVLDEAALAEVVAGADAVVHLAAVISIQNDAESLARMRAVNEEGTAKVLNAAYAAGIRTFVHGSSSHAYQHLADRALSSANGLVEEGANYDTTKGASHRQVRTFAADHPDLRYATIAPSGVIGRNDHEDTQMWGIFERYNIVRYAPVPAGQYAFVDVRQVAAVMADALHQLCDPARRDLIDKQEFLITGHTTSMLNFIYALQEATGNGHCLNYPGLNAPIVIPWTVLATLAPWCEQAARALGRQSLITSYSMGVLTSLPLGVDTSEKEKLRKFFGDLAEPIPLLETFRDRYEIRTHDAELEGEKEEGDGAEDEDKERYMANLLVC